MRRRATGPPSLLPGIDTHYILSLPGGHGREGGIENITQSTTKSSSFECSTLIACTVKDTDGPPYSMEVATLDDLVRV